MNNLYELFDSACSRLGTATAVEVQRADGVDAFSYDDLERVAARMASSLQARGCRKGNRVALFASNDAHWCGAFLGILRSGAVAVPLDTTYKPRQVATLLADCGVRHLIVGPRHFAVASDGVALAEQPVEILALDRIVAETGEPPQVPRCPATPDDPAVILYTSGTTADPKGVVLTHANVLSEREAAFQVLTVDESDVVLSVLPLFHALAMLANLVLPFSVGCRVVFLETVNTIELLRALRERRISAFCCVPQFFYLIHQRVMREIGAAGLPTRWLFRVLLNLNGWLRRGLRINLGRVFFGRIHRMLGPRMRLLVTGGSRFDPAIGRDLVRLGFDILQAYGLTECSGAATVTRPGDLNIESVGPPLPGVEVRIEPRRSDARNEPGVAVRDGEVLIRGPIVMAGYYNRPDANAETLAGGWLRTGDLGYIDDRGRLHITGREKEVIVLASGKNIYPEEIEAHYRQSPFIKELCVFGLSRPDEPADLRLHAVVVPDLEVLRERKMVNLREQLRFEIEDLSVQLPNQKRILGYDIRLEDLPRTTTRKLKRFEIEQQVLAGQTSEAALAPSEATPEDEAWLADPYVERMMTVLLEQVTPRARVTADANLELDLGLDSLARVELLASLEEASGVRVAEEVAQKIYTVRELIEALRTATVSSERSGKSGPAWDRLLREIPADDPVLAGLLRPRRLLTPVLYGIIRPLYLLARLSIRFRVSGLDRLPARPPFILSPNHQSYLDAFLLVSALPYRVFRRLFFVGASEYFSTPFMAWVARLINVVPVDPGSNLVKAMRAGAHGLRHDKVLILFPEGERSIDGSVKMFKKGAAILSLHLRVPIVPVAMDGVFDVWPRNRPFRWRALLPGNGVRVLMQMGSPLAPGDAAAVEAQYAAVTERLRGAVLEMWDALREDPDGERGFR